MSLSRIVEIQSEEDNNLLSPRLNLLSNLSLKLIDPSCFEIKTKGFSTLRETPKERVSKNSEIRSNEFRCKNLLRFIYGYNISL